MTWTNRLGAWKPLLAVVGACLIVAGSALAWLIQTADGVRIADVRFGGSKGLTMSGLLYIPRTATPQTPAPAVLAVHGYMNSRETQSPFAIELARRGFVVLALDQPGHGYSEPPTRANGWGGPDALAYLRNLPFVDKANIGLEGHSMGGWSVLAAAAAAPDDYKALILNGSTPGAPFAKDGTPTWPRNLAVVYGRYDEFARFFWQSSDAREVTKSKKLQTVFGLDGEAVPGRVYGSIDSGTARVLYAPSETHPQNHISRETVASNVAWFQQTLAGSKSLPPNEQIWLWKEIGTMIAFVGLVVFLLGIFDFLLTTPLFEGLMARQAQETPPVSRFQWWLSFSLLSFIPAITFLPLVVLGDKWLPPSSFWPQGVTNQFALWAMVNTLISLILGAVLPLPKRVWRARVLLSVLIAVLTVGAGYAALLIVDGLFKIDFRYWIVALKLMNASQFLTFFAYLIPFGAFCVVAARALHGALPVARKGRAYPYIVNMLALSLGFVVFLAVEYLWLLATGGLLLPTGVPVEALATIISMQFVPLLIVIAIICTFAYRRTTSYLPGGLISAFLVTWYIVAGQATHL